MPESMIRPRFRLAFPRRQIVALGPLLLAVWFTNRQSVEHVLWAALIGAAFGSAFVVHAWALSRRSRFGVRDGAVVYRGVVRQTVIANRGEPVTVTRVQRDGGETWWQVWSGPGGSRIFDERAWPAEALTKLARATEATITEDRDELNWSAFTRRYPSAMPFCSRNPVVFGIVIFVVGFFALLAFRDYS